MGLRLVSMITAAGTVHSDSTTEASLAQKQFKADELTPGKVFLFHASARVTSSNSTDTATPRVRFGTNATTPASNTEVAVGAAVDVANNDACVVTGQIDVHSATRAVVSGFITDVDAEGSKLVSPFFEVLTIAAGTVYYLDITADWSVASADNDIQAESFSVLEVV